MELLLEMLSFDEQQSPNHDLLQLTSVYARYLVQI